MDVLGVVWIPDYVIWIVLTVVALYIYGTWPYSKLANLGYKGPKPKPFFGNVDLIVGQGHLGAWDLTGKNKYGKVFAMYEGRQPTIVVFDTDMLKKIMVKDFSNFIDRRTLFLRGEIMVNSLLDVKGDEWKRIRSLNSPFFTTGKLKRNIQVLPECLRKLKVRCDDLADKGSDIDVKELMGGYTLEAICLTAFGLNIDSQEDPNHALLRAMKRVVQAMTAGSWLLWFGFTFPFALPLLEKVGISLWPAGTIDTFSELTMKAIEDRQKNPRESHDFIQVMLKPSEESEESLKSVNTGRTDSLTDKEIIAQVVLFLQAGYDTVATTLSFLLFNLANNQECQKKLLQEIQDVMGEQEMTYENLRQMTYLDMCLDESLRLYPPAMRFDRKCASDILINGYVIPKDSLVTIPAYALHRDPEFWSEPDKFDPERFNSENKKTINPYAYQPFGTGPRNCVGMKLGQIEVKMAAIYIIKHFVVSVGERNKLPLKLTGFFANVEGGLWLRFHKR